MKVTLNKVDSVNAILTIEIVKDDYVQRLKQRLKEISKEMELPGFRKGMVPHSLLEKKYGKVLLIEEVEKLLSEQLNTYITENHLNVMGDPIPRKNEQSNLNFETAGDYQFTFDLGLAPEINVQLTKDDILPYYTVIVTDEMIESRINQLRASHAVLESADQFEENDILKGLLVELNEEGAPLENGISNDQAIFMPSYIKEEEEKNKFLAAKLNDVITFNPFNAYKGNEIELASFLKIKKDEVNDHAGNFSFTINEITRNKNAEINQELFDKIYEPGTVTSEKQFRDEIKSLIARQLIFESNYKFFVDVKALLMEKNKDVQFADEILKRNILFADDKQTPESVEKDYPEMISMLKFQLIRNKIASENNISASEEELLLQAKITVNNQFVQYGMNYIPEDIVEKYAREMLKKKDVQKNLSEKIIDYKMIDILKEKLTLDPKEVTMEELQALFENPVK
jgi:trigger factor